MERPWQDDLAVHEFLDMTKASCADRRHRFVLHHSDLGAEIVRQAFPTRADVPAIVATHLKEDLGAVYTFQDWFDCVDQERLPTALARRLRIGRDGVARMIANKLHPQAVKEVRRVVDFLFSPLTHCSAEPSKALAPLMNASGLAVTRRVFGPPVEMGTAEDRVIVDYGWIAEAVIFTMYGRIPDLSEIITCIGREPGERV